MTKFLVFSSRWEGSYPPIYGVTKIYSDGTAIKEEGRLEDDSNKKTSTSRISKKSVGEILDIYDMYPEIFSIKKLEDFGWTRTDGADNIYEFSDGQRHNKLGGYTLGDVISDRHSEWIKDMPKLKLLAKVYKEIEKILIREGVIEKDY